MTTAAHLDTTRAARLFRPLTDQIRMDVVTLLLDGEQCVCDPMADLNLANRACSACLGTSRR